MSSNNAAVREKTLRGLVRNFSELGIRRKRDNKRYDTTL